MGTGDGAVQPRPGSVPVVLPGRRQSLPLTGPTRGVAPRASGQGASRWLLPVGRRGLSAAAWPGCAAAASRSASPGGVPADLAGCAAGISRRPGTPARCLAAPGLPPSRIRRWGAHRVPVDARDRVRAGCDTWPGTRRPPGSPLPGHRGRMDDGAARASPELSAWPGGSGASGLPVPPPGSR